MWIKNLRLKFFAIATRYGFDAWTHKAQDDVIDKEHEENIFFELFWEIFCISLWLLDWANGLVAENRILKEQIFTKPSYWILEYLSPKFYR